MDTGYNENGQPITSNGFLIISFNQLIDIFNENNLAEKVTVIQVKLRDYPIFHTVIVTNINPRRIGYFLLNGDNTYVSGSYSINDIQQINLVPEVVSRTQGTTDNFRPIPQHLLKQPYLFGDAYKAVLRNASNAMGVKKERRQNEEEGQSDEQ